MAQGTFIHYIKGLLLSQTRLGADSGERGGGKNTRLFPSEDFLFM